MPGVGSRPARRWSTSRGAGGQEYRRLVDGLGTWLAGAFGILVALTWFVLVVAVLGMVAFALRRRAFRRGTHPLRLLPWYLGGPPDADDYLPADRRSARERARRR